jgi:hypothetical protein
MKTVGELLDELRRFSRTAEVRAWEPGCEDTCERELDDVELQGGRVYLNLGIWRDDPEGH